MASMDGSMLADNENVRSDRVVARQVIQNVDRLGESQGLPILGALGWKRDQPDLDGLLPAASRLTSRGRQRPALS